jgi:hypothetical protein
MSELDQLRQTLDLFAMNATEEGYLAWAKAMADASEAILELEGKIDGQERNVAME